MSSDYTYDTTRKDKEYSHKIELKKSLTHSFEINSNLTYKGWEIIKVLSEGELKEGVKLIDDNDWVYEVKYDGESYYIQNNEEWDVSISHFTNNTHFRILGEEE